MEEKKDQPLANKPSTTPKEEKKGSKLFLILTIVFVITTCLCGGLAIKWHLELKQEKAEKNIVLSEKESMVLQLKNIKNRYEELGEAHEGLKENNAAKIEEISLLIADLEKANADVTKYRGIVWSKQKQLKEAEKKIEELEKVNMEITEDNMGLQEELDSTQTIADDLSDQNVELNEKVATGSQLKAYELIADAIRLKSNGKEIPTKKASRTDQLRFCFMLSENMIAPSGKTDIFVRIANPNSAILFKNKTDLFGYDNTELIYSVKETIDYKNQMMDLCFYWNDDKEMVPGIYNVDIFCNDYLIGSSTFELE